MPSRQRSGRADQALRGQPPGPARGSRRGPGRARARARDGDDQAGPERAEPRQVAPRDHQRADGQAGDRQHVGGPADERDEAVADRLADVAAVPARVEHAAEKEAEGGQAEADQLGMLMRSGAGAGASLADACGRLRA